jgi:hypothetical protein
MAVLWFRLCLINSGLPWPHLPSVFPVCHAIVQDLLYVMDQAVHQPLDIYFDLSPQSEAVQALVNPDVGKKGLSDGQSLRVYPASFFGVDFLHHLGGEAFANGNKQLFAFGTSSINAARS